LKKNNIIIFASGRGSNADNIIKHFSSFEDVTVSLIVTNRKNAGVLEIAKNNNIDFLVIEKSGLKNVQFHNTLKENGATLIVLAGFLLKIPIEFIVAFPRQIINIHPSLLPKYGGKGMYGDHVHQAVLENKENETGISVHWVNENYDEGLIIAQRKCSIKDCKTVDEIRGAVQKVEQETFPLIIEKLLEDEF